MDTIDTGAEDPSKLEAARKEAEKAKNLQTLFKGTKKNFSLQISQNHGILLPKLYWPTDRKNCSSDREKLLKLEDEGREFAKYLRSLEQFTVRAPL